MGIATGVAQKRRWGSPLPTSLRDSERRQRIRGRVPEPLGVLAAQVLLVLLLEDDLRDLDEVLEGGARLKGFLLGEACLLASQLAAVRDRQIVALLRDPGAADGPVEPGLVDLTLSRVEGAEPLAHPVAAAVVTNDQAGVERHPELFDRQIPAPLLASVGDSLLGGITLEVGHAPAHKSAVEGGNRDLGLRGVDQCSHDGSFLLGIVQASLLK
jgi:hypothetical protein